MVERLSGSFEELRMLKMMNDGRSTIQRQRQTFNENLAIDNAKLIQRRLRRCNMHVVKLGDMLSGLIRIIGG